MIGDGTYKIEIEDASNIWKDVTSRVTSCIDGTGSAGQVVSEVNIAFAKDVDEALHALIDQDTNRGRARIRITEGTDIRYYLLEDRSGQLDKSKDVPTIRGRAAAGLLVDWKRPTHTFSFDLPLSTIAQQLCQETVGQGGRTIPLTWSASLDPTVPGNRYQVANADRLETLREIARSVGGAVRCTPDGLGFEIYDIPARALTDSAVATYANPINPGSYRIERVDGIKNAVRVCGEVPEYTRPILPVIKVTVFPTSIEGDSASNATARALVYGRTGRPVQHEAIVDDSIDAGSYTVIPVSGCFEVQGVWLNTGTQPAPVKGDRVEPTTFDASSITVPDNGNQLFIVSYTRAESVSWSLYDYVDKIDGEAQDSTGALAVSVDYAIGRVRGVYLASDTRRIGTNFFTGGSATADGSNKDITLGISPGATGTALIIDYDKYNATPVNCSISPSSSLCDAAGFATTVVSSGSSVGLAIIDASALGQSGEAQLSVTGSAIASLDVVIDPGTLRAFTGVVGEVTEITDETDQVKADISLGYTRYYVETDFDVVSAGDLTVAVFGTKPAVGFDNTTDPSRIYIGSTDMITGYVATFSYSAILEETPSDSVATITATLAKDDGTAVTDGTTVQFEIKGYAFGAELSAESATTSDGVAEVTITAGEITDCIKVRVTAGPLVWEGCVEAVEAPTTADLDAIGGSGLPVGSSGDDCEEGYELNEDGECCRQIPKDYMNGTSICGKRRVVDCDGNPIAGAYIYIPNGSGSLQTDYNGYFSFCVTGPGSYTVIITHHGESTTASFNAADMEYDPFDEQYFTECS